MKIVAAKIGPIPRSFSDFLSMGQPSVSVTYENGTVEKLFSFYPDEISFYESEFIGKTREDALRLRHNRDVAYLRS